MFGSDQIVCPEVLRIAIENVESADFLTPAQKRDICGTRRLACPSHDQGLSPTSPDGD